MERVAVNNLKSVLGAQTYGFENDGAESTKTSMT